nr:hypothetical protein [Tanacetum cinerariifolium]
PAEGNGNGINAINEDTLQQASTSGTQSDNAPVYDSDGSTEYTDLQTELDRTKEKLDNCIIKKEKKYDVLWNNWYTKCEECKYDKISYDKAYNDMQQKIEWLQAQLGDLKGKPPSSSYKSKLYSITPFPKPLILLKVTKTNALSKPVTLNSAPSIQESKVVKTVNVISPRIFRTNPSKTSRQCLVTANHDVCMLNSVNEMNSHADNQSTNVSIRENQKKHKENANKLKELGSKESLASSSPSKPRTYLKWIPTGRISAMCGKLTTSSITENKSEKSVCDNASTSNLSKPSCKGFSNSASLLGRLSRIRKQHTSI